MQGERRKVVQCLTFPEPRDRFSDHRRCKRRGEELFVRVHEQLYVRTYDSTLLNEGGRYSRFVETSLSEIGSSPQKGERERERERFTSGKLSSVASLDSGCNSG